VLKFGSVREFLKKVTREQLLKLKGVGPETADSILLYAGNRPVFVADLYTRRMFFRLGLLEKQDGYEKVRTWFEARLPKEPEIYRQFHALVVEQAKKFCRKKPVCTGCPLRQVCREKH